MVRSGSDVLLLMLTSEAQQAREGHVHYRLHFISSSGIERSYMLQASDRDDRGGQSSRMGGVNDPPRNATETKLGKFQGWPTLMT